MLARISRRAAREVRRLILPRPEWLRKKALVDREFDRMNGVDTGGITNPNPADGPNWRDGVRHIAVDPDEFASAMSAVDADLSQLTFIDLGSGKGRALMLARQYPFKELIGVEFSGRLVEIARANGIETIHADATEYDLPPVPTLLFLYNPFGRETMDKVAERTRASLKASPREFVVLYLNPFQLESWTSNGFSVAHRGPHFAVLRV
jgi:SAM-dependent methyltransferase